MEETARGQDERIQSMGSPRVDGVRPSRLRAVFGRVASLRITGCRKGAEHRGTLLRGRIPALALR